MQETAAAQHLSKVQSLRRVTGKISIINGLGCLTAEKDPIDIIEEKIKVPNRPNTPTININLAAD